MSNSQTPQSTTPTSLFYQKMNPASPNALPTEVRELIWLHAMQYYGWPDACVDDGHPENPLYMTLPKITYLTKTCAPEILAVYLRSVNITSSSDVDSAMLHTWLKQEHIDGLKHIRALTFPQFTWLPRRAPTNGDLDLAAACPGLVELKMLFETSKIRKNITPTVWHVANRFQLHGLFECKSLKKVTLVHSGNHGVHSMKLLESLMDWIQEEFAKQGQEVDVMIAYGMY